MDMGHRTAMTGNDYFRPLLGDDVEPFVDGASSLRTGETIEIVAPGAGGYAPAIPRR
jgi:hypothetical protein